MLTFALLLSFGHPVHATDAPASACQIARGLIDIDNAGQVHLTKDAQGSFDLTNSKDFITIKGRGLKNYGRELTIQKDDQGRASVVKDQAPAAKDVMIPFGLIFEINRPEWHLTYEDGKCSIAKLMSGGQLKVDARMCGELTKIFKAQHECRSQCDAGVGEQLKAVIGKYQGNTAEAEKLEQALGVKPARTEFSQAQIYMQRCATPAMLPSVMNLAHNDVGAGAKPSPTPSAN